MCYGEQARISQEEICFSQCLYQNWSFLKSYCSLVVSSVKPAGMGAPSLYSLGPLVSAIAICYFASGMQGSLQPC